MSNTRNGLLAQIVQASGGTVTDASNRNSLLQDWLNAVSGPVGRWYFSGNGVDQRVSFASTQFFTGEFWLEAYVKMNSNGFHFAAHSDVGRIAFTANGELVVKVFETQSVAAPNPSILDNQVRLLRVMRSTSGTYSYSVDGVLQPATIDIAGDLPISSLCGGFTGVTSIPYLAGRIYNYSDSLGNVVPFDDSFANNPTIRNTGTGADLTAINATEASWSFE